MASLTGRQSFTPFWHVGVRVPDIEAARAEMSQALGLEWFDIRDNEVGEWSIRSCFSKQGPPFIELFEGAAGSPWEAPGPDHINYAVDDVAKASEQLAADGFALEVDGAPGWAFHRGATGLRIEIVAQTLLARFYERVDAGQSSPYAAPTSVSVSVPDRAER